MARSQLLLSFLLLAGQAVGKLNHVQNRYIIELEETHGIFARDGGSPSNIHRRMYSALDSRELDYRSHHEYASPGIFVGMSLTIENPSDLHRLGDIPGIKAVRPVKRFAKPHTPAPASSHKRPGALLSLSADPNTEPASDVLHALTGVEKLHDEGITGKGIKIAIIDGGIDYNHTALGGGFGTGYKIAGGYDYTGDDENHIRADDDPMDSCDGHGTHVAGIIGADMDDSPFKLHGVAFDAELYAYRVSACAGGMDDDVIVAALLRAEKDGCDVMNLSLGGPSGWIAGSSSSIVVSRLAKRGKVLTISAGNEGKYGAWYGSGPASGEGAIAVGSIESPVIPLQTVTVGGDVDHDPIMYYDLFPLTNNTKPIAVYAITEEMGYGCKPLPKDTPNLENYVVLVKLVGRCKRPKQMKNIMAKGAKLALVWNKPVFNNLDDDGVDIPVSLIQEKDGEFLEKQLLANKKITLTFPEDPVLAHYDTADGNLMDNFSTYGPTYDFRFKPSVSAHGGSILSTIPRSQGSYGFKSGTSMSAPYVAGCAALILQARGRSADVARQVRDLLETTSVPVLSNHSKNALLQTVTIAGAGMVDAYAAAHSETLLWPGELLLNDTKHFNGTQEFTVKNAGKENKKYSIDHYPAGTAITIKPGTTQVAPGPVPLSHSYASVELGATSFSLKPNEEKTITVKFTPPQGLDPKTLPVYSGFIQVAAEGEGEAGRLHVSYMGVAGSLYDQPVIEVTDRWHSTFTVPSIGKIDYEEETSKVQTKEQTYKFKGDEEYPKLYYRFSFGTPRYVIDLVSASLDLEKLPDPVPIFGNLENDTYVNLDYDTEDLSDAFWEVPLNNNATFSNGTFVPSGLYKILMRALRVTGDPENPDDYDKWLSPPITLEFTSDDKRLAAVSGNSTQDEEHGDHEADPDENGGQGADSEEHGGKGADSEEHEGQEADKDEQHEALIAEKPIYQRGWFIAIVIAAALLVIAGIAAGVIHHKRKRRSTIASEAAFVPAIGAYKPLVDETKEVGSYSATAYHARPAHEEGRYS